MRRLAALAGIVILSISSLTAGGQGEKASDSPVTRVDGEGFQVTDSLGRVVEFDQPPQRIFQAGKVAFLLTNTLYLFPEARERFLGTSRANQGFGFFAEAIDEGYGGKKVYEHSISIEELISYQPDLVIIKDFLANGMEKPLADFGVKTLFMNLETPEAFYNEVETVGAVFGNSERAEDIVSWYRSEMGEINAALEGADDGEKPEVLLLYYNLKDGVSSFNVPPLSYIQTDMVISSGGVPVWKDMELSSRWTKVGLEQIASWDPDYVFIVSYFSPAADVVEAIQKDPVWATLGAVKEDRIHAFPHDYHSWDQPGPGWILGYRWMAGILNPDLISSEPSVMEEEAREFFRFAYGVEDDTFNSKILPRIRGEED